MAHSLGAIITIGFLAETSEGIFYGLHDTVIVRLGLYFVKIGLENCAF